ncbi:porin family protein [Taibaiella koreensis]|uniref:porin family protein n=1 Tax=Taibaiella koreensis TaxID=1268548 RepID=UPI000E5A0C43|nr:porin family protein [Taibaiella koreensis]
MKKGIILAAMAVAATQFAHAQLSINPEAGINIANMSQKVAGNKITNDSRIGFKVGAMVDIGVVKGFYIQPGVLYSVKGFQNSETVLGTTIKSKTSLNYLEVPLNFAYRYDFDKAGAVFAAVGPYIGIGLNGKDKVEGGPLAGETDIKFGGDADQLKKIDYGANFSVGYISPIGIYVRAQYGMGLANLSNVDNVKIKNKVWGFSLGYTFQLNER